MRGPSEPSQSYARNPMQKPLSIDRSMCHGQDEEEQFKDIAVVDYWWGLRELAAAFDVDKLTTDSEGVPSEEQREQFAYLQILHYTVYVKLIGAFHQLGNMQRPRAPASRPRDSIHLRMFEAKEAFDALHGDLYAAVCALGNQLFTLLNRTSYQQPRRNKQPTQAGLSPGKVKEWLRKNSHTHCAALTSMLDGCDAQLDIRHHAIHYSYVPTLVDNRTGAILVQRDFDIGDILTRFDLQSYADQGRPLVTIWDASEKRATALCEKVDAVYKHAYVSGVFEDYMAYQGLKLKDSYQPYWQRNGEPVRTTSKRATGATSGSSFGRQP